MGKRHYDLNRCKRKLGARIRQIRQDKGWTLEECEEHGWGNWRVLQEIEMGQNVKLETLLKLANLFSVHPSEFIKDL